MANVKSVRKKLAKNVTIIVVLLILSLISNLLFAEEENSETTETTPQNEIIEQIQGETTESTDPSKESTTQETEGVLLFTMVDVGQGDGFVLEQNGFVAVLDCTTDSDCKSLIEYLNQKGITKIDILYLSHPHDDHIGGAPAVLDNFEIGTVVMPEVEGIDTDCYAELEELLYEGNYNIDYSKEGNVYNVGDATITVLEQQDGFLDEPNNYSAILKITYGDMDVIMTGDAETAVEKELLQSGQDISAEVLKVGHHGSNTSTSVKFLDAVAPEYALISCGLANKHKHPTEKIMERLESRDITVYRTDECGTVILTITKTDITFNCEPGDYLSGTELKEKVGEK